MDLPDWMRIMADKVREPFDPVQLDAADACAEHHETRGAMVLSFIGACAHQGWTTDETAKFIQYWFLFHELGPHGEDPTPDGELIDRLISPVTTHFRLEGAPWSRPWDATGLHALLVWHYVTSLVDQAAWDEIAQVELPRWTAGGALAVSLPQSRPARVATVELSGLQRDFPIKERPAAAKRREDDRKLQIGRWPTELQDREDLQQMFALRHWITWMQARAEGEPGALTDHAHEQLASLLDSTTARELTLPPLERELLQGGPDPDTQFCRDCLTAMCGRIILVDTFPDRIKGEDALASVPEKFVGGSRSMYPLSTTARTCFVYVLTTSSQVAGFERFFERPGFDVRIFQTHIALQPILADDSLPPLECDRSSVQSLWPLLLYLGGGFATVRALQLDGDAFRLLDYRALHLSTDLSETLTRAVAASLRDLTGDDPFNFPNTFRRNLEDEPEPLDRVLATEMARGGFLVSEFDLRFGPAVKTPDRVMTRYRRARSRLLGLRSAEAAVAAVTSDAPLPSEEVRAAQRDMIDLHRKLQIARKDPLGALARVLGDSNRALVLLRVDRGIVFADWACARPRDDTELDESSSTLLTESLELGSVRPLIDASNAWFESKTPASLAKVLDVIAEEIMVPLWMSLGEEKDLLLSPSWFLGLLPLHAAPIHGKRRAVDLFRSITYVPSGLLLDRVIELGPVRVHDCLAGTSTQPVSGATEELATLEILFASRSLSDITPEEVLRKPSPSIVHLAAHGYARVGGWSSGIQLSGESPAASYLSLARLLQEGNYSSTGVANIAACESGLELRYELLPDEYLSIDNALLACGARSVISSLWELSGSVSVAFSACFYVNVADGAQVKEAYRAAVSAVRSFGEADPPARVAGLLDRISPRWREKLQLEEERLGVGMHDPYFWACFKCSGWSWGALDGLHAAEQGALPAPLPETTSDARPDGVLP
jgi:hypothetical protein